MNYPGLSEENMKVIKPTGKQLTQAKLERNKTFARLIKSKDLLLRDEVSRVAKERGVWSDEKQLELDELRDVIIKGEAQLARGGRTLSGKAFSRTEAKELALEMMKARGDYFKLNMALSQFDQYTCESEADQAEFEYLCSVCILDDEDKLVFTSLDNYRERSDEEEVEKAAKELAKLIRNYDDEYDENWYDKLPEVSFLLRYKFVNKEYKLINEAGQLITEDGKIINEEGQLINESGELVNDFGERVDSDGNILDFVEFAD
jgi:hypothetical protein